MQAKADEHNREYERMLAEQQIEELRQSTIIETMKEKEKSEVEIRKQ